jgi:hypothetical protein
MKKNQGLKSSKGMRFVVEMPPELALLFRQEMVMMDRKKSSLARQIIWNYFRKKELWKEFEEFIQLRMVRGQQVPHFDDGPRLPQVSIHQKGIR